MLKILYWFSIEAIQSLYLIISLMAKYTAKKTDKIDKLNVNTGNSKLKYRSIFKPPNAPTVMITPICKAIVEYFA